jgi:CheY-like chemotaxis protein
MYRPPPLRGLSLLDGKKVLLIDRTQRSRELRAAVLRRHGVEVREAESLQAALLLWQPNVYDLVLLKVRRHFAGEVLEFYERIRKASPQQPFAFLVGPPLYISQTWPESTGPDGAPGEGDATIKRLLTAA